MVVGNINHFAVVVAAIASWIFGAAWYGVLGQQWMEAVGKGKDELMPGGRPKPVVMIVSFVAELIIAEMLAGSIAHLGVGQMTIKNALISAGFIWFGFVLTILVTTHAYQNEKRALTVIDGGHWLGVLLIQGLVLGLIGA